MAGQPTYNPFAPPAAPPGAPLGAPYVPPTAPADIAEALRRLHDFVANPANLDWDRRERGRIVPIGAYVMGGIGVLAIAGGIVWALQGSDLDVGGGAAVGLLGFLFALVAGILFYRYTSIVSRDLPAYPAATLTSFLKAVQLARDGYAWSCLSPTAREQVVYVPSLAPVVTRQGTYPLRGAADWKEYVTSIARTSAGTMRFVTVKNVVEAPSDGVVARVTADLLFQSYPRWVWAVLVMGFVVFRPLVVIGIVLYFVTRKRHKARVTKTLLRAQNGVWYLYDGSLLEGGVPI